MNQQLTTGIGLVALCLPVLAKSGNEGAEDYALKADWLETNAPLGSANTAQGTDAQDDGFSVYWKNGLFMESADKDFKIQVGGRIQHDWGWFSGDELKAAGFDLSDGSEFRRARLFVGGTVYGNIAFKAQYDFAGSDVSKADLWLQFKDLPFSPKVGHFKEPFGLEEQTSSRFITFMERSSASEAFAPARNNGLMIGESIKDGQGSWKLGVFRDTDSDGFDTGDGELAVTGRVTFAPIMEEEEEKVLHLGLAYSFRDADDGVERFRARPEAHILDRFIDTGSVPADSSTIGGVEAAYVQGPFSVQGEFMQASIDPSAGSDLDFSGYYAQATYTLTGESRPYKASSGAFGRIKPKEDYAKGGGKGAWELAARYTGVDLNDGGLTGGELDNLALGVNWYMNPHTKMALNYVMADLDTVDTGDWLMVRFHIDF